MTVRQVRDEPDEKEGLTVIPTAAVMVMPYLLRRPRGRKLPKSASA